MIKDKYVKYNSGYDKLSMIISSICVIHCVIFPLLLTTLTIWKIEILENIWLELIINTATIIFGGWAVWNGYKNYHFKTIIPLVFIVALVFLIIGSFIHDEYLEMVFKLIGSIAIIMLHVLNWKYAKSCVACKNNTKPILLKAG